MSIYKQAGSKSWYADIEVPGSKRIRKSTGTSDKTQAQRIHDEWRAELWNKKPVIDWHSACLRWLEARPRSTTDRYMLRKLAEVQEVTPAGFQALLANLKPSSFNRYRALIVAICNLSRIPFELPKKAVTEQRIRFLTEDEWKRLYEAIPPHLQPILTFALKTGMRRSNVLNLEWNQVDIPRKHLWIHADTAKGRKTFGIPLADAAVEVLIGQLGKHNAYVFPHTVYKEAGIPKTGPIGSIKTAFLNACVKAGLGTYRKWKDADGKQHKEYSGIRFHDLRHTFASWHLMSGTSMEALKELGAWSDLQMVLRYGHLDKEHLRAQANNAKPWNPGTSVT